MAAKKREIYARCAVQLRTHDRCRIAERICNGAMGLYLFLLLQARGEQTFGDSSEDAAYESWGAPISYRKKQLRALIEAGLVEFRDGRPHVVKYEEHNDTPADIKANRDATKKRVDAHRERVAQANDVTRYNDVTEPSCNGDVPISISISSSGSDLGGELERGPGPASGETAGARYQAAYAAGIARGKCSPWVWPGGKYAEWDLGKIISGHAVDPNGKPYRGEQLLRFVETTAAEFASDVIEAKTAQYYSAFSPKGCLKWLNEAALAAEARRVG